MGYAKTFLAALAATATLVCTPAASANEIESAKQIRKLDMMLMATSLRCRFGADNFQSHYNQLRQSHQQNFKLAAERVLGDMTRKMGRKRAINAYDRMSTAMANEYGLGHPWLDCAELKAHTIALTKARGMAALQQSATDLLASRPTSRVAFKN